MPRPRRAVSLSLPTHALLHGLACETGESATLLVARLILREAQRRNRQAERRRQREAEAAANAERQRTAPRLREFPFPVFPGTHAVHIPASVHGFHTNDVAIQVFVNTGEGLQPYWPYDLDVSPSLTITITLSSSHEGTTSAAFFAQQGGLVVISGLVPFDDTTPPPAHCSMGTSD